jgi:MFS transporter, MFS domain-containing protein family, molybdate-anion transporter
MYLFVFVWVPTLQDAANTATLPLGIIFSAFMLSMMIGSLLYTAIVSNPPPTRPGQQGDSSLTLHAKLSSLVCATSAFALAASVSSPSEYVRFGAFCVFEGCVGMYYPVQGMLRGALISDGHRATVKPFALPRFHQLTPPILSYPRCSECRSTCL